jgi:AraC-like DNA-binding protein
MKPFVEQVSRERNFNWRVKRPGCESSVFEWHYHLEYEIVLFRHRQGQLFAGGYQGSYGHNSLAMFGPRLPHTTIDHGPSDPNKKTLILWFSHAWISQIIESNPDWRALTTLLDNANHGLTFEPALAETLFQHLEGFEDLSLMLQSHRFLEVLLLMAEASSFTKLNKQGHVDFTSDTDSLERVQKAVSFIENSYRLPITMADLAEHLHMSSSSVHRLFDKHFLESFSEHLKQYRIGKACELLINTHQPIAIISEQVGFGNLSNFNRQFKQCKHQTPREFRDRFLKSASVK